jgi:2-keto-4-pentenoate hydratase/2-oxohepta-3-ene-1,7-dioic acid hydratase in catechol pathway
VKLVTFSLRDGLLRDQVGLIDGERILSLTGLTGDMHEVVAGGEEKLAKIRETRATLPQHALAECTLHVPLKPGKVLCCGVNYKEHAAQHTTPPPSEPFFFAKLPSSLVGPDAEVEKSPFTEQLDYEVEFAVVIGKPLYRASEEEVMPAIFGYTLLNDSSARDMQKRNNQITLGKNFVGSAPLGPCIVTADELADPNDVRLMTRLNGTLLQDGTTSDWLFPLPTLISFLTRYVPLQPGDVVSTGTPAGNGISRNPQIFMKAGDVVEIESPSIGVLRTAFV